MFRSSNQYNKLKIIGSGAYGKTFLVDDKSNSSNVYSVKVCDFDFIANEGKTLEQKKKLVAKTLHEVEFMKTIQHANIIKVFSSFQENNCLHVVMEYCTGGTLKQAILARQQGNGFFPEDTVRHWAAQLTMALLHLHNEKIIHRDVRSENVFLTCNGRIAKLSNLGIAKVVDTTESSLGLLLGGNPYVAPEMRQGKTYSTKTDVWAFGVLIYELISLHLPFLDANVLPFMYLTANSTNQIRPLPNNYSVELRRLVTAKLLERDVAKRPEMSQVICDSCIFPTVTALSPKSTFQPASVDGKQVLASYNRKNQRKKLVRKIVIITAVVITVVVMAIIITKASIGKLGF